MVTKLIVKTGCNFDDLAESMTNHGVTHWTPGDWIGSKWNGSAVARRDLPQNSGENLAVSSAKE
jgi:hypothetical protein